MRRTFSPLQGKLHQLKALLVPGSRALLSASPRTRMVVGRYRWLLWSTALAGLLTATIFRFYGLAAKSVSVEEASTFVAATQPLRSLVEQSAGTAGSPPLFYLLTHLSLRLVGDSDLALRLPASLAGILLVAAISWTALRLFGRGAAVLSLLLSTLSPVGVQIAQDARPVSLVMLLSTFTAITWWEAVQSRRVTWWFLSSLTTILAIYTSYLLLLLLIAQGVFIGAWLLKQPRGHQRPVWSLLVATIPAVVVLSLPQFQVALRELSAGQVSSAVPATALLERLSASFATNLSPAIAFWNWIHFFGRNWIAIAWIIFALIALEESTWSTKQRAATFYLLSMIAVPLLLLLINPLTGTQPQDFLVILPFYLLLVARGIQLSLQHMATLLPTATLAPLVQGIIWGVALVGLVLLHARPLEEYFRSKPGYFRDKPEYRAAAAYLEEAWRPGELVLAGTESTSKAIGRYFPINPPLSTANIRSLVESGRAGYIVDDIGVTDGRGYVDYLPRDAGWLEQHLVPAQEQPGVRVYRFGSTTSAGTPYLQIDLWDTRTRGQHTQAVPFQREGWARDTFHLSGRVWAITSGNRSSVQAILRPETAYQMLFQMRPFRLTEQVLSVWLNGQLLHTGYLPQGLSQHEIVIPAGLARAGLNTIELEHVAMQQPDQEPRVIGTTGVEAPADISVRSVSTERGNLSNIFVNGRQYSYELQGRGYDRGYTVVVLDAAGNVVQLETFDTFASSEESQRLAQFIAVIPAGRIVIMTTRDEASTSLTEEAVEAIRSLGGTEDLRGKLRWMHSLVGIKGAEPGTALEQARRTETRLILGKDPQAEALMIDRIILAPADRTSMLFGSNWREPEPGQRWATSPASLKIISAADQQATLVVRPSALHDPRATNGIGTEGTLHIQVEGRYATSIDMTVGQTTSIPLELRQGDQNVTLTLEAGNFRPADYGGSDPSILSFAVESIDLQQQLDD
jgi:hypothetical protein